MKISLDAAMRARDVSQPTAVDEAAAASVAEAQDRTQPPDAVRADAAGQGTGPAPVPGPGVTGSGVTGGRGRPAPPHRPRPARRTPT
jgi:hypothetical protein